MPKAIYQNTPYVIDQLIPNLCIFFIQYIKYYILVQYLVIMNMTTLGQAGQMFPSSISGLTYCSALSLSVKPTRKNNIYEIRQQAFKSIHNIYPSIVYSYCTAAQKQVINHLCAINKVFAWHQ